MRPVNGNTDKMLVRASTAITIAFCLCAVFLVDATSVRAQSNTLEGIRPFPLDYDSGAMALHAFKSCLDVYGVRIAYPRLVAVSGAAFKCVYDSSESYEPLRDLYPIDVLSQAAKALGFDDANWQINNPIEEVKAIVKHEIDNGRPVIAPFLKPDAYHGFFIIFGYDFDENIFYLQGAFEGDSAGVSVPIPDTWDGPTVSHIGWATNPIFVIGRRSEERPQTAVADKWAVELGMDLMKGGTLAYGNHPGETVYMRDKGIREASYGFPAYDVLSHEVGKQSLLVSMGGKDRLDFGFIWRIDAQVGQLQHDRRHGSVFLRRLGGRYPPEISMRVDRASTSFEEAAADARNLRQIFWDEIPETLDTALEIVEYVEGSTSIVFRVVDSEKVKQDLEELGFHILGTLWGPVFVVDSPDKRRLAKMLVKSIATWDKISLGIMKEIVGYIGMDRGRRSPTDTRRPGKTDG